MGTKSPSTKPTIEGQTSARPRLFVKRAVAAVSTLAVTAATLVGGLSGPAVAASDQYLYWTAQPGEGNNIARSDADGKNVNKSFLTGFESPLGLAANKTSVFWSSSVAPPHQSIGRAGLNGTGVNRNLFTSERFTYSTAASDSKIYWSSSSSDDEPVISRGNANGSGTPEASFIQVPNYDPGAGLAVSNQFVMGVAVDSKYIYWNYNADVVDASDPNILVEKKGFIGSANIDGTGIQPQLVDDVYYAYSLASNGRNLFWPNADLGSGLYTIARSEVDGTAINRQLVEVDGLVAGVAVDLTNVYWTDAGTAPGEGRIGRASVNGGAVNRDVVTGLDFPFSLALASANSNPSTKKNQQFRKGTPPKKVKFRGTTVLNKARATTKQRRPLSAKVRVTFPRGELRCLKVRTLKNRKVTVRTYGRCTFTLRVTYTAPGNSQYKAFEKTKVYRVKR